MKTEATDRAKSKNLAALKNLWPFIAPLKSNVFLALVLLALAALATLSLPVAVRQMIDLGFDPAHQDEIGRYFLLMLAVALAMGTFSSLRYFWVSWIGERVIADMRKTVYQRVLSMSPGFFETTSTGEVLSRINTDTSVVETVVGSTFSIALRSTVMFSGALAMMIYTSPKLALMICALLPVIILPIVFLGKKVRALSKINQDQIAGLSALATETINAVTTVQAFAQTAREKQQFNTQAEHVFVSARKRFKAESLMSFLIVTLVFIGIISVLWMGAGMVIAGSMSSGTLGQFVLYAIMAATSTGALSQVYGEMQRAAGALERLMELMHMQSDIKTAQNPIAVPEAFSGNIRFSNINFSYPAYPDKPVLKDINLNIKAGEKVAIVGPSGAGKSTLFQLLLRFYDPDSGDILINDIKLRDFEPEQWRKHLALVSQQVTLFAKNARDNICYGHPDASEEELQKASKAAFADQFISKLPEGYNSFLGEKGIRLSGGQAQRLAIARALIIDPPILLLDEATSALDAESERKVQQALEASMEGRTTLVIAHRLATVRAVDRIIVLEDGQISAQGTHEELLESNPLYAHLAKLQFTDQ
ncbi:MAG: ABC transporter transmembrane domain-containing protein [bacterium]